jgi:hypothetical protein
MDQQAATNIISLQAFIMKKLALQENIPQIRRTMFHDL